MWTCCWWATHVAHCCCEYVHVITCMFASPIADRMLVLQFYACTTDTCNISMYLMLYYHQFQSPVYTPADFSRLASQLHSEGRTAGVATRWNSHESIFGVGNWDINVLMVTEGGHMSSAWNVCGAGWSSTQLGSAIRHVADVTDMWYVGMHLLVCHIMISWIVRCSVPSPIKGLLYIGSIVNNVRNV